MEFINQIRQLHPQALPIGVALVTGGIIHTWKTVWPTSFRRVPPKLKAFPATIIAAVSAAGLSAASGQVDVAQILMDTLAGSFSGLMAVGGHETIARARHGSKYHQARKRTVIGAVSTTTGTLKSPLSEKPKPSVDKQDLVE